MQKSSPLYVLKREDIQMGDVLLFHGEDGESRLIEAGTDSLWSHVGTAVKLLSSTVDALRTFVTSLPPNWKANAAQIAVMATAVRDGCGNPWAEEGLWGPSSWMRNPRDSRMQHTSEMLVAMFMLKNNNVMTEAIRNECLIAKSLEASNGEVEIPFDARTLYFWESTTSDDESTRCAMTGLTDAGVKLSILDVRAKGYQGAVGIRHLKQNEILDSRLRNLLYAKSAIVDTPSNRHKALVLTVLANIVVNLKKPYEKDYTEMADAWGYGDFFCNRRSDLFCYGVGRCLYYAMCCCFCPSPSSPDYHRTGEYDSFYCSELTMQLLYDHVLTHYVRAFDMVTFDRSKLDASDAGTKMLLVFDQPAALAERSTTSQNVYVYASDSSGESWNKSLADPYYHVNRTSDKPEIVETHEIVCKYYACMAQLLKGIVRENCESSFASEKDARSLVYDNPSPSLGRTSVTPGYIADRDLRLPYVLEPVQQYSLTYTAFL
jgi:hypothetical protein